ncbi:MAG TPA: single-stranded DNA-binding protein [Candidatus Goldiibacteriota bacterium]|nr:single-stranded DNA-binding protein [Candidatus Goldiibacteriota bacterium]
MPNLNKVFLMGNLTKDLELKYGRNGQPVTNARLAVNRAYTTQSGEKKEEVCYVTVVIWGKQAEACHTYLRKGSPIFIEGRLQFRSWDDEATQTKKNVLEVVAERVQFLDRKRKEEGEQSAGIDEVPDTETPNQGGGDSVPF